MAIDLSHTVNADQSTFLGFGLEGIFYGVHLLLLGTALVLFVRRKSLKNSSVAPILAATLILFCLCTLHFALNFNNVYVSLMVHVRPHIAGETPLLLAADTSFLLADFFGQLVLIYRCYLVWGRNVWAVILPILLALGSVSCGMAVTGIVQQTSPTSNQVPVALIPMGDATFSLSIICNFITTGLIVGRLWILSRGMDAALINGKAQSLAQKAIGIIIESGLLFFLTQFVFIVLFALAHPAQAIIEPIACQVYAISPLLILVRVGMGMSYEQSTFETTDHGRATHSHTNTHSTSLHFSGARMGGSASKMDGSTADYEMGAYEEQSKEIPSVVEV